MKGHYNNGFGWEWAEINGSEGSAVYKPDRAEHDPRGPSPPVAQAGGGPAGVPGASRQPAEPAGRGPEHRRSRYDLVRADLGDRRGPALIPGFDRRRRSPSRWRTPCSNRTRRRPGSTSSSTSIEVSSP